MSKLMSVFGIVLLAIGVALALVGLVNPAQMQVYGLTIETAAILLVGGILSIGIGGIIAALAGPMPAQAAAASVEEVSVPAVEAATPAATLTVEAPAASAEAEASAPARIRFPGFGRKAVEAATGVAAGVAGAATAVAERASDTASAAAASTTSAVDDTIAALEQAKADIANAIGGVGSLAQETLQPHDEAPEEFEDEVTEEPADDGELYVLEEREIRGRPARILSDHTVEAETDEGWMRFENLEHLNEYLDAAGEPA